MLKEFQLQLILEFLNLNIHNYMEIKVIDNFFEEDLINFLYDQYRTKTPHYLGITSNGYGEAFYETVLNLDDVIHRYLCLKISKIFPYSVSFFKLTINVQHTFMEGDFHQDDGDTTALIMISRSLKKNSGCFEIRENNLKVKKVDFIQNRFILFPAKWSHRGRAPIEKNVERITLVFKTKKA